MTVTTAFASTLSAAPATAVNDTHVDHWVTDSFNLARTTVYVNPADRCDDRPVLDSGSAALDLGKSQVALAGARLAKLINDSLR